MGLKDLLNTEITIDFNPLRINLVPVFRSKLFLSDKPYIIEKEQKEGEKKLIKLCSTAEREEAWEYYKETNVWIHLTCQHKKEYNSETKIAQIRCQPNRTEPTKEIMGCLGSEVVKYHIHPISNFDYWQS